MPKLPQSTQFILDAADAIQLAYNVFLVNEHA